MADPSQGPNKVVKWAVLVIASLVCAAAFWGMLKPAAPAPSPTPSSTPDQAKTDPAKDVSKGIEQSPSAAPTNTPPVTPPTATPAASPTPAPTASPARTLAAAIVGPAATPPASLGGLDAAGSDTMRVEFSLAGAGVKEITLAKFFTEIDRKTHVTVQRERSSITGKPITPMALLGVQIDGIYVDLLSPEVWRETAPGVFEATIRDTAAGVDAATITRRYELVKDTYTIRAVQTLANKTDRPMQVRWYQLGPTEMPADKISYGGDMRRTRFGYLVDPASDPSRQLILANDSAVVLPHANVVGPRDAQGRVPFEMTLWPNQASGKRGYELVWAGGTNRYFTSIALPIVDLSASPPNRAMTKVESVDRLYLVGSNGEELVPLRLSGRPLTVPPDSSGDFSMGLYAGPQSAREIRKDPVAVAAGIDQVVLFNFGGMCGCCTFAWLTEPLLKLLIVLHDYVTKDWALAIMLLVVIVRGLLHPITKWSQIRVQRFGKQMQNIAPKMQQIKEKYSADPKKQQEETARLWREEGINPAGMLGCLPMFLQTPVWIALSAMLFFAIEIRHEGAFFGLFQKFGTPDGNFPFWFLGDLAEPDRLVYFHKTLFTVPLMGEISSFNILPLLMGVLFYVQQKYMSPPPSATMTPEQELQMKMMKWMTVFMFPLMMYNAPSGLTLYFFTNSVLGILESKWIKKHIDKHDLLNVDKMREERKAAGGGWWAKLQARAERAKAMQAELAKKQGGAAKPGPSPDRFRKR